MPDAKQTAKKVGIAALILSASILLSRVLGFLREAVVLYLHGASEVTDAYYAAFTLPDLMSYFLAGGTLSITFIPLFSSFISKGDEEGGWRLFSIVATTMGSALALFTVIAFLLAPYVVPKLNPGFDSAEQIELAIAMTRIVLPAQLLFYFGGLLNATLFVRETFWPAAISPLIYNVCIIAGGLLLAPWLGIQGFAVGVLAGALLGPFGVPFLASRKHLRFKLEFNPRDKGFQQFVLLTLPLLIGVGLVTVDDWLLKFFGSSVDGAISWLSNSRKLMLVCFAIIGQAAGQAALPFMTRLFHEEKEEELAELMTTSLRRVVFLATIAACGLIVAAIPIVYVIFQRGAFSADDANMTSMLLVLFAAGLPAWAAQTFIARGFYARKNTLTPMVISTCVVGVAVPLYWFLYGVFDIPGLALASSAGMTVNAVVSLIVYRYTIGGIRLLDVFKGWALGVVIGGSAGSLAWVVSSQFPYFQQFGPGPQFITGLIMGAVFLGVIVTIGFVFKPRDLWFVLEKVARRIKR